MVGRQGRGGQLHQLGQEEHPTDESQLGRVGQQGDVATRGLHPPLRRVAEDAGDAGVGILDIVDGVLLGFGLGQLQVEVHLGVGGALEQEESHRVGPHLVRHLPQGDDVPRPLGEAHHLAAPLQRDKLVEDEGQAIRVQPKSLHHGLHAGHMPLVVSAPDVNDPVEAPHHKLVVVIGDVGGEVAGLPVGADDDVVLVLA